ncbi:hypothetical protein ACTXJR_18340 [Glutamicibacter ardleyensis]|uniref:hypothetical protein n=1 Tax=Glutamicibacter ardleyensis TaxID=225894 RepID=UPI003FCEEA1D
MAILTPKNHWDPGLSDAPVGLLLASATKSWQPGILLQEDRQRYVPTSLQLNMAPALQSPARSSAEPQ